MTDVYGAQVRAQLAQAQRELSAARATIEAQQREALKTAARLRAAESELAVLQQRYDDEHAAAVERAHETDRAHKQLAEAHAKLAALHEGEEPYEDERMVPTPGQWIWHWNRATPEERLEIAANRLDLLERQRRIWEALVTYADRPGLKDAVRAAFDSGRPGYPDPVECGHEAALGQAEARIAAVRALHYGEGSKWGDGTLQCFICREPNYPCSTVAALDGPAEQPADTCRVVEVDGEPVRVRSGGMFTEKDREMFAEVIRAAKRRYAAEHPSADDREPPSAESGRNAEDCPACDGTNLPYPFLCPGHTVEPEEPPAFDIVPCRCGHERVEHGEASCRACVFTGRRALSQHGYIAEYNRTA